MGDTTNQIKATGIALAGVAAGILVRKLMESGYRKIFYEEPPNKVTDRSVHWSKVLGWTLVSGAAVSAARLLVKRAGARKIES